MTFDPNYTTKLENLVMALAREQQLTLEQTRLLADVTRAQRLRRVRVPVLLRSEGLKESKFSGVLESTSNDRKARKN